jgi:dTDP-4-dehydrorhamnose 3,5-epimerase
VRVIPSELPEVLVVEPRVYHDARGFFVETYRYDTYRTGGIPDVFVQDNHSRSAGRILRGLHLQVGRPQAKLVRVVSGEIFDVAVDVRHGSPTFGRWVGFVLSAENFLQCYVPAGFAHGFCVLSASADVEYKCSDIYVPEAEIGIRWDDPALAIAWPVTDPLLSDRDKAHPPLAAVLDRLPRYQAS